MAALAFKVQNGVDHVLYHPRPGDLAILGDVAHQNDRNTALLGEGHQFMCRRADLRH